MTPIMEPAVEAFSVAFSIDIILRVNYLQFVREAKERTASN